MTVTYAVVAALEADLQRKRAQLVQMDALVEDVAALERVIQMRKSEKRRAPTVAGRQSRQAHANVSIAALDGATLEEAAVTLAEQNDDVLRFTGARRRMVEVGLLRDGNAGSTRLFEALAKSDRFERGDKRGVYNLVAAVVVEDEREMEKPDEEEPIPTRVPHSLYPIAATARDAAVAVQESGLSSLSVSGR